MAEKFKSLELGNYYFKANPFKSKISEMEKKGQAMNYAYWKQGLLYYFPMLEKLMMSCQHVNFWGCSGRVKMFTGNID